jgi:hypothetical protein
MKERIKYGRLTDNPLHRKGKDMRKKIFKWAIALSVIAFLFIQPLTRQVILFILPLGSGVDDLIFVVVGIIALVAWFVFGWTGLRKENRR